MFSNNTTRFWTALAILAAAAGLAYHTASHPMDYRVYYYGARGVFDGTRPVYGPQSGLGWPMHYRYPPLFLLLFAPFAWLPLGAGAAVWAVLKVLVLAWLLRNSVSDTKFVIPALFMAPYVVEEFRYGNAQFFVFALTAAALWTARERPVLSAAGLALAISIKVWPLFFVPYLAARKDRKVAGYTLGLVALLALVPSLYFGFPGNLHLLGQWFSQEVQTQLGESEIWFPNQSLRGVLMRYLTLIDYSRVPDSNYPLVNVAALDPAMVRGIWLALAGIIYGGFLILAYRTRDSNGWIEHGLAFGLLALLEPFTQKYALIVLLWPAFAAWSAANTPGVRAFFYAAAILALVQPLAPGAGVQRYLQALGLDFFSAVLLIGPVALLHARTLSGRIL